MKPCSSTWTEHLEETDEVILSSSINAVFEWQWWSARSYPQTCFSGHEGNTWGSSWSPPGPVYHIAAARFPGWRTAGSAEDRSWSDVSQPEDTTQQLLPRSLSGHILHNPPRNKEKKKSRYKSRYSSQKIFICVLQFWRMSALCALWSNCTRGHYGGPLCGGGWGESSAAPPPQRLGHVPGMFLQQRWVWTTKPAVDDFMESMRP